MTETETPSRTRWLRIAVATVLLLLLLGRWLADHTANRLWADSVGVGEPHRGIAQLSLMLLALAFTSAALWCVGNVYLFYRSIGSVHVPRRVGNIEFLEAVPRPYLLTGAVAVGLLLAIVVSHNAGDWWTTQVLLREGQGVGARDPVLNRDVGYYLFVLPWYRTLHAFVTLLAGTMLAVIALLYAGVGAIRWTRRRLQVGDLARMHLAGLFAAFAFTLFWGYQLEPAEFVAGIHQVPLDATLVDVRIPVARLLAVLALRAAGESFAWLWFPSTGVMAGAWTVLVVVSLVGHHVLPAFSVSVRDEGRLVPAEVERATAELQRLAYGLERHDSTIPPPLPRDSRSLAARRGQLRASPVWDAFAVAGALNASLDPADHVRFLDASLGLYRSSSGQPVSAYVAVREVDQARVRDGGKVTWEQQHTLPYGHSNGIVAVAAAAAGPEGRPVFLRSLGPADSASAGLVDVRLAAPATFFSPAAGDFAIVGGEPGEFVGVRGGGVLQRIALAWALQSPRLVTSDLLGPDVEILWERQIASRLARYAPFAEFGAPYPVVAGNRLYWLASGYVTSETFPSGNAMRWHGRTVRYLRAGFIGVVDAHSGQTAVYLVPAADPLSMAWARRAPEIIRGFDRLPVELAEHLRYPEELFDVQATLIRGPLLAAAPSPAASRGRAPALDLARRSRPLWWWIGPWTSDTVTRLRVVGRFESEESTGLSGIVAGTLVDGRPVLDVVRFSPALELAGAAEITRRLADQRTPSVGVTGARRIAPLADGVLAAQATYATGDGPPRISEVVVQWGAGVTRGPTLIAAVDNVLASRNEGGSGGDWSSAQRWFDRMEEARLRGDWAAFGRSYDALRRLLSGH